MIFGRHVRACHLCHFAAYRPPRLIDRNILHFSRRSIWEEVTQVTRGHEVGNPDTCHIASTDSLPKAAGRAVVHQAVVGG